MPIIICASSVDSGAEGATSRLVWRSVAVSPGWKGAGLGAGDGEACCSGQIERRRVQPAQRRSSSCAGRVRGARVVRCQFDWVIAGKDIGTGEIPAYILEHLKILIRF